MISWESSRLIQNCIKHFQYAVSLIFQGHFAVHVANCLYKSSQDLSFKCLEAGMVICCARLYSRQPSRIISGLLPCKDTFKCFSEVESEWVGTCTAVLWDHKCLTWAPPPWGKIPLVCRSRYQNYAVSFVLDLHLHEALCGSVSALVTAGSCSPCTYLFLQKKSGTLLRKRFLTS